MPDDFYREIREVFEDSAYPVCIMTASKPGLSLTDNIHRTEILCGQLFDAGQKSFSLHAHYTDANGIMADEILTFISKGYECLYSNEKQISLYKSLAWAFEQKFLLYKLSGRKFFVYDANIDSQATHNSELLLSMLEYPPVRNLDDVINIFRNIKGEDYFVEDKIIMCSRWMKDNFGKQARAWVSADLDKYGDNAIINRIGDFFTWNKEHFDSERISAYQTILAANSPAARQYQEYAKQKHIEEIERQIRELNKPPSYGLDSNGCFSSSLLPDDGVLAHGMEYLYNLLNSHNTLFSFAIYDKSPTGTDRLSQSEIILKLLSDAGCSTLFLEFPPLSSPCLHGITFVWNDGMADITLLKLIKSCAYFGDQEFILYKSRNKNFYRLGTMSADESNLGKLIVNNATFVEQLLTDCFKTKIPSMSSAQVRVIHRRKGADVGEHIKVITGFVRKYGLNGVAKYYGKDVEPLPFPKGVTLPD